MTHSVFISRKKAEWLAVNAEKVWNYVPFESGISWITSRKGVSLSKKYAGGKQIKYYSVRYQGIYYYCHHVVWTLHNGLIPPNVQIDHKDRNGHNNKIENLVIKSSSRNNHNRAPHGRSGYKGVSFFARDNRWLARLGTSKGFKFLGYYDCPVEAALVWDRAALKEGRTKEDLNFPELV